MNPHILLFSDSAQVTKAFRPGGVYKVASILRANGYKVIVNPYCTDLTKRGWQEVAKKYKSKNLIWVGFSTTFLTFNVEKLKNWREQFENSHSEIIQHKEPVDLRFERIVEDIVYNDNHLDWLQKLFDVPLLIGGSQLTRNKNIGKTSNKKIITVPGYVEDILLDITSKLQQKKNWTDGRKGYYGFDRESYNRSEFIFTHDDHIEENEWLPLEVNRGCAFKCAYCTYDNIGIKENYKTSSTLLKEIQRNHEQFGTKGYYVLDDLYNDSQKKVKDLYNNVWSQVDVEWNAYCRLDLLWRFPDQLNILQDSGLKATGFGIETLNDQAGKVVGKGLGRDRIMEIIIKMKEVWKDDVRTYGLWIAGLPGESTDSWERTLEWQLAQGGDLIHAHHWQPLYINHKYDTIHKSDIDKDYEKYGYYIKDDIWYHKDGYSRRTAIDFAKKANEHLEKHAIRIDHHGYGVLRNVGIDHGTIMKKWVYNKRQILGKIYAEKNLQKRQRFTKKFLY